MSKKDPALTLVPTAAEIDSLYQLPLDQFTPERNALAKRAGKADPSIKALEKPNIAAWAVNQLYWRERGTYDALIGAAEALRAEHRNLLAGKSSDVRTAERAHRDAVRAATERIKSLLGGAEQAATPATLNAVSETLAALPADVHPGRLTKPLKPMGFEALSDVPARPPSALSAKPTARTLTAVPSPAERKQEEAAAKRAAEAAAREEAREKERLIAEMKKAKAAHEKAAAAVAKAEAEVDQLERALADARKTRDRLQTDATLAKNESAHAARKVRD
jgi:hypothetical protein